jgi:hypothetical protein
MKMSAKRNVCVNFTHEDDIMIDIREMKSERNVYVNVVVRFQRR